MRKWVGFSRVSSSTSMVFLASIKACWRMGRWRWDVFICPTLDSRTPRNQIIIILDVEKKKGRDHRSNRIWVGRPRAIPIFFFYLPPRLRRLAPPPPPASGPLPWRLLLSISIIFRCKDPTSTSSQLTIESAIEVSGRINDRFRQPMAMQIIDW